METALIPRLGGRGGGLRVSMAIEEGAPSCSGLLSNPSALWGWGFWVTRSV